MNIDGSPFPLTPPLRVTHARPRGIKCPISDLAFPMEFQLEIGHLDSIEGGYYRGEIPVENEMSFRSAVEEFQCEHGLAFDGICGANTQGQLEKAHGS